MKKQSVNSKINPHTIVICANLLVRDNNEYFVMKRSPHKAIAPNLVVPFGGKLDIDEHPLDCAIRELAEESGLAAKDIKLAAVVTELHKSPDMLGNWITYYFIGEYKSGIVIENPEGKTLKLTALQLKKQKLFPSFKAILPYILKKNSKPIIALMSFNENHELTAQKINVC